MTAYSTPLYQLLAYVAFMTGVSLTGNVYGQLYNSPTPFSMYYYDYKLANPAFTGTMDKHVITTVYSGLYNDTWLAKKIYGAYEAKLEAIKSGIGVVVQYNEVAQKPNEFDGEKYLQSGVMYSRQLSFTQTSGLYLGTQLLYQREKRDNDYELVTAPVPNPNPSPDTIYAGTLIGRESYFNEINFDIGAAFYSSDVIVSAAVKNMVHTDHDEMGLNLMVKRIFRISPWLKVSPSAFYLTDFKQYNFRINTVIEFNRWVLVGVDYEIGPFFLEELTFNVGLNIKDRVQIISHIYSPEAKQLGTSVIEAMLRVRIPGKETKEGS